MFIPLAKPTLGGAEIKQITEAVDSAWVTQGPKVEAFEKSVARYTSAKYSCAVSNCTTGLHLSLKAAGVGPGDLVITVSHSFIATANAVRYCNAEPLFVDIDPQTFNMCPQALDAFIVNNCTNKQDGLFYNDVAKLRSGESPLCFVQEHLQGRIAAIMPVHQIGIPCDIESILKIANKYNLPVIEDAACALGSKIKIAGKWENIGKPHGDYACFSFHPRKIITTGDGGIITCKKANSDNMFRLWRQHGMGISDKDRHSASKVIIEDYLTTGYNYRLTDLQAGCGIAQMDRLEHIVAERRRLANIYCDQLQNIGWLRILKEPDYAKGTYQSFAVRLTPDSPFTQIDILSKLKEAGIGCKPGIMNAHEQDPYKSQNWILPESEKAFRETILLPLYVGLTEENIQTIVTLLKNL